MFLLNLFETVNHKHAYLDIVVGYIFGPPKIFGMSSVVNDNGTWVTRGHMLSRRECRNISRRRLYDSAPYLWNVWCRRCCIVIFYYFFYFFIIFIWYLCVVKWCDDCSYFQVWTQVLGMYQGRFTFPNFCNYDIMDFDYIVVCTVYYKCRNSRITGCERNSVMLWLAVHEVFST